MILLLKKGASKEENLMWVKAQMAYKAGFRHTSEAHGEDCTCDREYAIKSEHLTKEDLINGRA